MNMGHGLSANDPTITAAFRTALVHQFLAIVFLGSCDSSVGAVTCP